MTDAKFLFMLTDVDGLYTLDPRKHPSAKLLLEVNDFAEVNQELQPCALPAWKNQDASYALGSGGMGTIVRACRTASCCGIVSAILNGSKAEKMIEYMNWSFDPAAHERPTDSTLVPVTRRLKGHSRYIACVRPVAFIDLTENAITALHQKKTKSALSIRCISKIRGSFAKNDVVALVRVEDSYWVGQIQAMYSSEEILSGIFDDDAIIAHSDHVALL